MRTAKDLLLGKAHQKLQNRLKAKDCYQAALLQDASCFEVSLELGALGSVGCRLSMH